MRFGLGWRTELGAGILANLDRIDLIEVMADDYFDATSDQRRALRFLRSQVPVVVHATSLGLASPEPVDRKRLDAIARVIGWLEPELWSEHLAFVRFGTTEVGHLAAPPRNDATLEGLVRNVEQARRATGSAPLLENVASLVDPPFSAYGEGAWLNAVLAATGCRLLLDLHNLHANATNFGFDARAVVSGLPPECIGAVHLAGGRRIEGERILDDHLHAVPGDVYSLLALVHAEAPVILERDGNYPPIDVLLGELQAARDVPRSPLTTAGGVQPDRVSAFEKSGVERAVLRFLSQLYTDDALLRRFVANPLAESRRAGFGEEAARTLAALDLEDLQLAARSFSRKRAHKTVPSMRFTKSAPKASDGVVAPGAGAERKTSDTASSADSTVNV